MLHRLTLLRFLLISCCSLASVTFALNIDPRESTAVSTGVGDSGTSFGWAVSQHQLSNGTKVALVGAPKANSTGQRLGGVYSCPYDNQGSCQFLETFLSTQLPMDPSAPFDPFAISEISSDFVSNQMMGYSLRSLGNRVVSCAPLYVARLTFAAEIDGVMYNTGDPNGRCIILDSDFNLVNQLFSGDGSTLGLSLAGLDSTLFEEGGQEKFLLPSSFARLGTGPRSGQVITGNLLGDTDAQMAGLMNVPYDTLLGYHVETGTFTAANQLAVSAPRSNNHLGQVVIYDAATLATVTTLEGEEADGYFGYDFAALESGRPDGRQTLVVGCPLCARERGRVYVYAPSQADGFTRSEIEAPSSLLGRFGLAVENIGDIDMDGIEDVAVAAPYQESGVVYIYRGSDTGVVAQDFQTIPAAEGAAVFGYSISGGMDVDGNGYPDATVSSLQNGRVYTFRGSPLVDVTIVIKDRAEVLDILSNSDRLCPLNDIDLHCFNVSACFYFNSTSEDVQQFRLSYSISADEERSRVFIYMPLPGGGASVGGTEVTGEVMLPGPGRDNMRCVDTVTFALNPNFVEADSIPVTVSVDDATDPIALPEDPALAKFGDPLHPVLRKYTRGDQPAPITITYEIPSNLNCTSGDPSVCEGDFSITVSDILESNDTLTVNGSLVLASSNEFGFRVTVTNEAMDAAVSPTLLIQLPQQTRLRGTIPPLMCENDFSSDNITTVMGCALKNPLAPGEAVVTEVYFFFNDTTALLETRNLSILFSVRDGGTTVVSQAVDTVFTLDAVGEYSFSIRTALGEYRALRSAVIFPDVDALLLAQLGPQVILNVEVLNGRGTSSGTTFPRSIIYIYVPREEGGGERSPLLIPESVGVTGGSSATTNCSEFGTILTELPPNQQPVDFLPAWTGPPPPSSPECERNGSVRCGVIICTLFDLQPLPQPPTIINVFLRLYSPSIDELRPVFFHSFIESETELPRLGENNVDSGTRLLRLAPGTVEAQRECIRYWVVVVSVVIGIVTVVAIVIVVTLCTMLYRWWKYRKVASLNDDGVEQTDNEYSYHRRTIPPIAHLTNGGSQTSPPPPTGGGAADSKDKFGMGFISLTSKEKEAEDELAAELEEMNQFSSQKSPPGNMELTFDPSKGLDEGEFYEGGEETDI